MISIIVPVFYNKKNYIVDRAKEIIDLFEMQNELELIIADASKLHLLSSTSKNVKVVKIKYLEDEFSPAIARNLAVDHATKKYLFFMDVDLAFSEHFIESLKNEIKEQLIKNNKKFLMLPCFYLTKMGTDFYEEAENKIEAIQELRESLLLGENKLVERLAVNTSAIILEKNYFIKIGKFNEDFFGHGGEDFELLHKLVSYSPHSKQSDDYFTDEVSQFAAKYIGFRRYMAYYALEYAFTELVVIHRWHVRPLFNYFYMKRQKNESLLIKKMREHDLNTKNRTWQKVTLRQEYESFILDLMKKHGYSSSKYIGLFKFAHNIKLNRPISAKARKLLTRPKKFFMDIKWVNPFFK